MPGSVINTNSFISNGTGGSATLAVQAGDLIVVGVCAFYPYGSGPPWDYTFSDTAGNVYDSRVAAARGWGHVAYAWAIATTTETITIDFTDIAGVQYHTMIVANVRWDDGEAPPLSEWAMLMGPSNGPPSAPFYPPFSSPFSIADSTVITFAGAVGSLGAVNFVSHTGDTEVLRSGSSPAQSLALFIRNSTGPGIENSQIENDLGLGYAGQAPMVVGVFSRPLARPGGTTAQYQLRPGTGFTSSPGNEGGFEAPYYIGEVNRPICATLAYLPLVGSLLCVGVSQQSHVVTPTVSDDYGNTYTLRGISPIAGSAANQCVVALYTCVVANLPPAGQAFIVRASLPGPYTGVIYQPTAIGVAEKVITGQTIIGYQVAVFDDVFVDVFKTEALTVTSGTYLFAFAANATFSEASVVWTALAGFNLRSNWGFSQALDASVTNDARCGASAIIDLVAGADGDYAAEIQDLRDIGGTPAGGMALLGVELESAPPPPTTGGITRGMSILTSKQWATLREKGLRAAMPTDIYLDQEFPNAGFHVWPIPTQEHDIEFYYWSVLQQFSDVTDDIEMPPGFYDAIMFNLAVQLCQAYKRRVPAEILAKAIAAKDAIRQINAQIISGSYQEARTLMGPSIGKPEPKTLGAPEPTLKPGFENQ